MQRLETWGQIAVVAVLAGLVNLGCERSGPQPLPKSRGSQPADSEASEVKSGDVLEQLRAIGYVGGQTPATLAKGVIHIDFEKAQAGLNFYTSGHGPGALLIDMQGEVRHQWQARFEEIFPNHPDPFRGDNYWRHAQLLPDGSVLGIWETYGIFKLDKDSKVIWSQPNRAHHDLFVTESGEIYHLAFERTILPELGERPVVDDLIVKLAPDGRELQRWSMAAALKNTDWPRLREDFWRREASRKTHLAPPAQLDPFHTNSLWILSANEVELLGDPFKAGDILVSMCLLDTIAVLDLKEGVTRWWITGPFALQHQPRVTANGGIVLFNNYQSSSASSIQILDPKSGEVTWEYRGPTSDPLFSTTSSTAEMLPNGNILVVETNKGRVLEVTLQKEVVWEFRNPYRLDKGGELVANVFNLDRVGRESLEWLRGN